MQSRAFAVLFLLLTSLPAAAQQYGESVQVNVVEVPVTVVDRDGHAVRGLTRENFELYDEGKRVPIDYFEAVDLASIGVRSITEEAERPLPPVATRNFLLLFDLENSSPGVIGRAQDAAIEFLGSGLSERDLIAVATFSAHKGVQLVTSFSSDRELTRRAVETLGSPKRFRATDPLLLSASIPQHIEGDPSGRLAGRDAIYAELALEHNLATQPFNDTQMRNRLRVQLNNFGRIAQVLNHLHGQKQIILLSEGFDARLVQGREDLLSPQSREEVDQVFYGQAFKVDSDQRYGNTTASRDVSEMAELFRRSDVVLHAIDIAGLRGDMDVQNSGRKKSAEALFLLTTPTGGTVFKNVNDLGENFKRMLAQQEVVYVLGFNAKPGGTPGTFHTLKVKTANVKASRVAHRSGYYEESERISDLERTLSLAEILAIDAPIDDVAVSVTATAVPGRGGDARVPVVLEIPGKRLLQEVRGDVATANLFLYAFDATGRVRDHLQQRIALDLPKTGETLRSTGIRYYGTLRLPPGRYALKALVRVEESGRIGFARNDVHVPTFNEAVVLPPLMLEEPRKWVMLTGPARGDEYPYPFTAGGTKFIPRAEPMLKSGGEYKLALFLYRMPIEGLGLAPVIATRDGKMTQTANLSLVGRTQADDRGGTKLVFDFRPDGLKAGEYELQLSVKPKEGSESMVRMPFVLQ
ncbi:MAG TPA: VWA domain-containing protein [Thermoanaerobaculia bacterium]|jgi:VWFA-related protein